MRSTIIRWPAVISVAALILIGFQVFRVNRIESPKEEVFSDTFTQEGILFEGALELPSSDYRAFPISLNRRARVTAAFASSDRRSQIAARLMDEKNFTSWRVGEKHSSLAFTGYQSAGRIEMVVAPGKYYLIFENLNYQDRSVKATITAEVGRP